MVRLGDVFALAADRPPRPPPSAKRITLVIIGQAGCELGLLVDRVLGEEDIVIKSMAENFRNVPGIAGASILGDGRVSLILDLAALIDIAAKKSAAVPQAA